ATDTDGDCITDYSDSMTFPRPATQTPFPCTTLFRSGDQGSHSFHVTLVTAGDQYIAVSDVNQPDSTGSAGVSVSPAALDHLAINTDANTVEHDSLEDTVSPVDA